MGMTARSDSSASGAHQRLSAYVPRQVTDEQDRLLAAALVEIDHLETALEHRTVIGQATGILVERYGLSPDGAMAYLRRVSQDSNRKLYDIAAELVATPSTSDVGPPAATGGTATGDSADAQHARELLRQVHDQVHDRVHDRVHGSALGEEVAAAVRPDRPVQASGPGVGTVVGTADVSST